MESLFARLATKYPVAAQCAAALGMTRQAYSQAEQRRRLSESKAILAGKLLGIDLAESLLINHAAANDPAPPILNTAPDAGSETNERRADNTNYATFDSTKKTACAADNCLHVHYITSQDQDAAIDLIRWVYAVADLPADSPRFAWYVSRWDVPSKIARAKANGTFDALTANCRPIDPAWIRFVPAALDAWREFINPKREAKPISAKSSGTKHKGRNTAPLAA